MTIRFFDVVISLVTILLLTPLLFPIIFLLKLTGEHDVFYKQMRVGKRDKMFGLIKFATMLKNSPNMSGGLYTSKNDPRMLPLGLFLRKTKINELPQLLNIFFGQMSLVGPRPQVQAHFDFFPEKVKQILYKMKPGLTGIGSIVFRDEENILSKTDKRDYFYKEVIAPYKGELEVWYYQNYSFLLYWKVIFTTVWVVLFPKANVFKLYRNIPKPQNKILQNFLLKNDKKSN